MLRIEGLVKRYGDLVAVGGIDLRADGGDIVALLGPNGAGKSTTVKCLVGLLEPDEGTIRIGGVDALGDPAAAKRMISYVPEITALYDELSPDEYLGLRGRLFGLDEARIAAATERLLEGFGLGGRRHAPLSEMSKGMSQKVALAAALLTEPKLLVLDEPLAGLDVETTFVFKEIVREFAARGGTVLYCSHLLDVVETVAARIVVIDRGRIVAEGTLQELRDHAGDDDARLEELFRRLTESADPTARAREILGS